MIGETPASGERGFTLVEVLVALVMTAALLLVVLDGAATARGNLARARSQADAARLGEAILARARAHALDDDSGSEAGLAWQLSRRTIEQDPRGLFALVEYRVDISGRGDRAIDSYDVRAIEPVLQ